MKVVEKKRIPESICDSCGAIVEHVDVVETLPASGQGLGPARSEPAEYGDRCPNCQALTSFTKLDLLVAFVAKKLLSSREIAMEKWLIFKRHMTYGDARSVIRRAKAMTARAMPEKE